MRIDGETYPELTLVGWYTFGDEPLSWHMNVQMQFQKGFECDHALFMLCHHNQLLESDSESRLPFTIYESSSQEGDGMEVDSPPCESSAGKFRPITFASLETSAVEAIVLADVAQLATNAASAQQSSVPALQAESKGKEKAVDTDEGETEPSNYLSTGDEERKFNRSYDKAVLTQSVIQSLNAKAASINMLKSRLNVIIDYLGSQRPSYLTDASLPVATDAVPDQKILRSIYALATQVNLTAPADGSGISNDSARTQTHVELIGLLSSLTRSMQDIKTLGSRQNMVETQKSSNLNAGGIFAQQDFEGHG
jgi:hypothetical protein